jgi:hypothetical protein
MNAFLHFKFFFLLFLGLFSRNDDDVAEVSTSAPPAMNSASNETDPEQGTTNGDATGDMTDGGAGTGGGVDTTTGTDTTTVNGGTASTDSGADTGYGPVVQQDTINAIDLGGLLGNEGLVADLTDGLGLTGAEAVVDGGLLGDLIGDEGLVADLTDGLGLTGEEAVVDGGLLGDLIDDEGLVADLTDGLGLTGEEAVVDGGLLGDLIDDEGLVADLTDGLGLTSETTDVSDQLEPVDTPFLDLFPELSSLCFEDLERATATENSLPVELEAFIAIEVDIGSDYSDLNAMFGLTALVQSDIPEDEEEDDEDVLFFL